MSLSPCNACTVRSRGRHAKHGHRWGETPRPTDGFEARRCQYGFAHGFKSFKIRGSGASGYIHGKTAWEIIEFHFVLFTCYRSNRIRTQPRNPEGPSTPNMLCQTIPSILRHKRLHDKEEISGHFKPRGSIYPTIMELGPKRPSLLWLWGPNSIMVVHMDPLGNINKEAFGGKP